MDFFCGWVLKDGMCTGGRLERGETAVSRFSSRPEVKVMKKDEVSLRLSLSNVNPRTTLHEVDVINFP